MGARVAVNPTPRKAEQLADGLPLVVIDGEPQFVEAPATERAGTS